MFSAKGMLSYHWIHTTHSDGRVPPKCHQNEKANERLSAFAFKLLILLKFLVALPGLEPGLFALRGRRVNQLHHNAMEVCGGLHTLQTHATS
jgi:hypothetical protein